MYYLIVRYFIKFGKVFSAIFLWINYNMNKFAFHLLYDKWTKKYMSMIFRFILMHFFLLTTRWGIWRGASLRFPHVCVRLSVPWSALHIATFHVSSFSTIARHFSLRVTSINQTIHGNALLCCSGCYSISFSLLDFRGAYDNGRILLLLPIYRTITWPIMSSWRRKLPRRQTVSMLFPNRSSRRNRPWKPMPG